MCDNGSILSIFLILKVIILLILPVTLFILYKKESKLFNVVGVINILFIVILILLRISNNSCVVNSTFDGINMSISNDSANAIKETDDINVNPNMDYVTYNNKKVYYYNQNMDSIKNSYYTCGDKKTYMNSFGNIFTSFATVISTLNNSNISPVSLFNDYKMNIDICNTKMTIDKVYSSAFKKYDNLKIIEINSSQIEGLVKKGNLILVEVTANENSNFTCDSGYIIIYNINLEGKYMILNSSLTGSDFVCPYSSPAYGRVIKNNIIDKSWSINEIGNEAVHYYRIYLEDGTGND